MEEMTNKTQIYHEGLNQFTFSFQKDKILALAKNEIILPICIEISPSDRCTQDCYYCNTENYREKFRRILKKEPFLNFIKSVSHPGQVIKYVGGGEPLLNPYTLTAMQTAKANMAKNYIITNLEPIKRTKIGELLDHCNWIRISVDDFAEDVYNKIRRPLNKKGYTRVMENLVQLFELRRAGNYDINIGAQMVALEENVINIRANGVKAKELGFDFLQIRPDEYSCKKLKSAIMESAMREAEKAGDELSDDGFKIFPFEHKFSAMKNRYSKIVDGEICYASNFFLIVGGGGDVFPCIYKTRPQFVIGNIYEDSIEDILASEKSKKARIKNAKDCKSCCKYLSIDKHIHRIMQNPNYEPPKDICF